MGLILKPRVGLRLNYTHPLARGLVGCWLMNEGAGDKIYDLSNSKTASITGGTWEWDGLLCDATDEYIDLPISHIQNFANLGTIVIGYRNTKAMYYSVLWASNGGTAQREFQCYLQSTGFASLYVNTVLCLTHSIGVADTKAHILSCGWDVAGDREFIQVDSKYESATTAITTPDTGAFLRVGNRIMSDSNRDCDGVIKFCHIYDHYLSVAEIAWLHREPYAMFEQPRLWAMYDVAVAAGAEFELLVGAGGMDGGFLGGGLNPMTG